MKIFSFLFSFLALVCVANATTWNTEFTGSLTTTNTQLYHYWVFPAAGTANISCAGNSSSTFQLVGVLSRSGSSVASNSAGGTNYASFSISNKQVWPVDTYSIRMMCPYGSCSYYARVSLTYVLNSPPVISSMTATPLTAAYGDPVTVTVSATDAGGDLSYVRFVNGNVSVDDNASPYSHVYTGLAVGTYTITAYAVDATGQSDDASVQVKITERPITVKAKSGESLVGTNPSGQGVELVSGTLASGDSLQSLGISVNPTITSTTAKGTYVINVVGSPSGYTITRQSGSWSVKLSTIAITVRAKSGESFVGTNPSGQGVELVSGTLASGDSLQSLGLSVNPTITSTTAKGTYVINVVGSPSGYTITRQSGSWSVKASTIPTSYDTDNDSLPDWLEQELSNNGFSITSIKNANIPVASSELSPPNGGVVYLCPGQPLE